MRDNPFLVENPESDEMLKKIQHQLSTQEKHPDKKEVASYETTSRITT